MSVNLGYRDWAQRGWVIHNTGSKAYCIGNLLVALEELGAAIRCALKVQGRY